MGNHVALRAAMGAIFVLALSAQSASAGSLRQDVSGVTGAKRLLFTEPRNPAPTTPQDKFIAEPNHITIAVVAECSG
jgi:hypothetical protein